MPRAGVLLIVLAATVVVPGCGLFRRGPSAETSDVLDLNRASLRRIEKLPGITPSMARRIVDGRPYQAPHDLVERGILTERELERILDRIRVEIREE